VLLSLEGYTTRSPATASKACESWTRKASIWCCSTWPARQAALKFCPNQGAPARAAGHHDHRYGTVDNVVDAIRAGAENFVQKPWDNEKLLADIRSAVARHKAEKRTCNSNVPQAAL